MTDLTHSTVTGVTPPRGPAGAHPALLRRLLLGWATMHGVFALGCYVAGVPLFGFGPHPAPAALNWFAVAVAALAAGMVLVAAKDGERPAVRRMLWVLAGLSLVSGFSLLMDVIALLTGALPDSLPAAAHHGLGLLGAILLVANARTNQAGSYSTRTARPEPSAASRRVHLAAFAGTAAFLPYAAMKTIWAFGGSYAGVSGAHVQAVSRRNGASGLWQTLESWGLDPTALLSALGIFLLFGLIRPWGQVFPRWAAFLAGRPVPRWLPLAPALLGAATLVPYGLFGVGWLTLASFGGAKIAAGDFGPGADALLIGWTGLGAFAVYGVALAVAARSYWRRTRPLPRG